jgi:hypothetical protein
LQPASQKPISYRPAKVVCAHLGSGARHYRDICRRRDGN